MGNVVSGDLREITYNHPTLGSGVFLPKSAEDSTFDLGGLRTDDDANNSDGGGRNIKKMNRVKWMFEGPVSWDMNIADELTQLKKLAADPVDAEWTITHVNGTVWSATGGPVGDIQGNSNAGTIALKIMGGGEMKKIVG